MSIENFKGYNPESERVEREEPIEVMKDWLAKLADLRVSITEQEYVDLHRRDSLERLLQAVEVILVDEAKIRTDPDHKSHNFTAELKISQALSLIKHDSEERHKKPETLSSI